MKKTSIISWLFMLCMGLLIPSCSYNDNPDNGQQLGANQLKMSVKFPGDYETRSDEVLTHKLRYIMELWSKEAEPRLLRHEEQLLDAVQDFTIDTDLASGTYTCMLWVDYVDADAVSSETQPVVSADIDKYAHFPDKYFDTSDLRAVKIKDNLAMIDNDYCDAFFYTGELVKEDGKGLGVEIALVRPLTKISIIENNAREFSLLSGVKTSYDAYTVFNVMTGSRGDEKETVNYDNQNFNPSAKTNNSIIDFCMFANADDGMLGSISLVLNHEKNGEKTINVPDIIPLERGANVKLSADMLDESPSDFEITFDVEIDEWEIVDKDVVASKPQPKVGDFFYADGTFSTSYIADVDNPVIGIVFAVVNGGAAAGDRLENYPDSPLKEIRGWVVAIREDYDDDSGKKAPATVADFTDNLDFVAKFGQGKEDILGYKNTLVFKNMTSEELASYPIAQAILSFNNTLKAPENTSGWYWGALKQYRILSEVYAANKDYLIVGNSINDLREKGVNASFFSEKSPEQFYWSSTIENQNSCKFMRIGLGKDGKNYGQAAGWNSNDARNYRPILTF